MPLTSCVTIWDMTTTTVSVTVGSVGELIRVWRSVADVSLKDLTQLVNDRLPQSDRISYQTLWRYERDEIKPSGGGVLILLAITEALGRKISELPIDVQDDINRVESLLRNRYSAASVQCAA